MQVAQGTARSLCVVLLLSAGWPLPAQNVVRHIGSIAPAHGALVDGSGCRGLHDILARDGYDVALQEPLASSQDEVAAGERFPNDLVPMGDAPAAPSSGSPALDGERPQRDVCGRSGPGQPPAGRVPSQVLRLVLTALLQRLPGGGVQGGQGLHAMAALLSRPQPLPRAAFAPR